ncbi:hypothetical protein [Streptomyces sp. NPDC088789]
MNSARARTALREVVAALSPWTTTASVLDLTVRLEQSTTSPCAHATATR